jgi:hypothetical protein
MAKTFTFPRLTFDKKMDRSLTYDLATDDGAVITKELSVISGCAKWAEIGRAFLIDADNQYLNEYGMWVQVGGERCAWPKTTRVPRPPNENNKTHREVINEIYKENKAMAKLTQFINASKETSLGKITWIIAIICISILLSIFLNRGG